MGISDWVIVVAVGWTALAVLVGFVVGRVIRNADLEQKREQWQRQADASRAARLREQGRLTDVREDATGAPAVVRPMTVLGKSPRHRPPTRM